MKIVVLAGGTSTEREISIVSGTGICDALRQKGHEAILVDIFCGVEDVDWENPFPAEYDVEKAAEYMKSFNPQIKEMQKTRRSFFGPNVLKLCEACDIVFLGLHGANGEDGKVQAAFDLMGIRYTGTGYLSSAMAMDKGITKEVFQMNHVPTPGGFSMPTSALEKDIAKHGLSFPVVVKTSCGGSSVGVYIVNDQKEYEEALADASQYQDDIVVEEYINTIGMVKTFIEFDIYQMSYELYYSGTHVGSFENKEDALYEYQQCIAKLHHIYDKYESHERFLKSRHLHIRHYIEEASMQNLPLEKCLINHLGKEQGHSVYKEYVS